MMRALAIVPITLCVVACSSPCPPHLRDARPMSEPEMAPSAPFDVCSEDLKTPTERLWPARGELYYAQLGLGGLSLGEAAVVVGPDGTVVLIDVANDSHDDDVQEALEAVRCQMNARGFAVRGADEVDHAIITHFHADHGDGIEDLMDDLTLSGKVVHRGFYDLTQAANLDTAGKLCMVLREQLAPEQNVRLCTGPAQAPCDPDNRRGRNFPAERCLDNDNTRLSLGGDAGIDFVGANGWIAGRSFEAEVGPIKRKESNGENARSVVGVIRHGAFSLMFTGDLTGGHHGTDNIESFFARHLTEAGVSELGVDVLHAGHHGRRTSTNPDWLDRLAPDDGHDRTIVMGISAAHAGSPQAEVLNRIFTGSRLGQGRAWTTTVATGGARHPRLTSARGGQIIVRTLHGGDAYAVQAIDENGDVITSKVHRTLGVCDPQ